MKTENILGMMIFCTYTLIILGPGLFLYEITREMDRTLAIREVQAGHMPTNCVFEENCIFTTKELKELGVNIQYIKEVKEN